CFVRERVPFRDLSPRKAGWRGSSKRAPAECATPICYTILPRRGRHRQLESAANRAILAGMATANTTPGSAPQPSTSTSRSLLERVRADDPAAWERLVGLYSPLVYHWCR